MMRINQIWEELENDESYTKGLLLRRYSGSILPDLYIALHSPEKQRCIAVSFGKTVHLDLSIFNNLRIIQLTSASNEDLPDKQLLIIKLIDYQNKDIFSVLCEDLILSVKEVSSEPKLAKVLLNRFEKWKSLFEKAQGDGLSEEAQRGLYGELYFLRIILKQLQKYSACISAWVGPEKQIRDFQKNDWAVEVKTTRGKNHQKIQISSERQLDTTTIKNLILFHISLDVKIDAGETLPLIIDSIQTMIADDYAVLQLFKNKLYEAGYFTHHSSLYENTGYELRQNTFYKVEGTFPRIEESDIPSGVGDVKYSIIASNCSQYILSLSDACNLIKL